MNGPIHTITPGEPMTWERLRQLDRRLKRDVLRLALARFDFVDLLVVDPGLRGKKIERAYSHDHARRAYDLGGL